MRTESAAVAVPAEHQQVGVGAGGDDLPFHPTRTGIPGRRSAESLLRQVEQFGGRRHGICRHRPGS
jgi:hypothetical protein